MTVGLCDVYGVWVLKGTLQAFELCSQNEKERASGSTFSALFSQCCSGDVVQMKLRWSAFIQFVFSLTEIGVALAVGGLCCTVCGLYKCVLLCICARVYVCVYGA